MDDLWCDGDALIPCDLAAFEEAALTLLLIMAVVLCIGIAFDRLRHD